MGSSSQRRALRLVTSAAERRLQLVWSQLDVSDARSVMAGLNDLLPAVGDVYGTAASSLAADYYDETRLRKGARGRFQAELANGADVERWYALSAWGTKPLYGPVPNPGAALTLIQGGLQKTVANQYRDTIRVNSVHDKAASGWQRVGAGECDFCQMLLGRGTVYTEATADFEAHDHCGCSAEPVFK